MKEYNMLAYLKGKLNLYEIDDMDVEEFRDVIQTLSNVLLKEQR